MDSTADQRSRGFLDSIWARLIALVIAALLLFALWASWNTEITALVRGNLSAPAIIEQPKPDANVVNVALQDCLTKRIGDVEQMQSEGILSDHQYEDFRQNAEQLCYAQHQK
ncbi:hypothetical protein [Qingshengfaniella alkalisoli]|uniref:Uncharacterized protein n=1 Tax=Qingshengfaniella alkalisoli TaxID=2599296 RepID=A0A5B8I9R8_9RHOB|nr:hypothetical protein [Qingshengfaniella alkalisoli]QDY69796.1 hypothetical protein FPZ52_09300 [Qingshengfaniella alkalisoli]